MPESERHSVVIWPDGTVVVPDLTEALHGLAPGEPLPWSLGRHAQADLAERASEARRLLGPTCRLCARQCAVDRRVGQRGFCRLGAEVHFACAGLLWGEEPELGRPGLALAPVGCGLRCAFCYRPELLPPASHEGPAPEPAAFPQAAHLHLLGGNPDESLPAILDMLSAWQDPRPVVWNTHAYLTDVGATLLEGVADAVVADLKFGPGPCAGQLAGVADYWPVATATLQRLAGLDLDLLVRHVALPGHLECCARPVAQWLTEHLPAGRWRLLDQYEPWGAAWRMAGLDRRLSQAERDALAALKG